MSIQFENAIRKASPMLIGIAGVSGSGKTYTALLMAAGIAGPGGRVGFIDTENGRGSMYADEPGIVEALPNGYQIAQLDSPYSPERYIEAIETAEKAGFRVLVIDSASHEYEGIGGIEEIAEKEKVKGRANWAKAKMLHKRFMNHCLSTDMHLIFCLRAREKTRPVRNPETGKEEYVSLGIQPIAEKNFMFEMTVSLMVAEDTHFSNPVKVPKPLIHLFPGGKMLTKEDGERIRLWNETGSSLGANEQLIKRSRAAVERGVTKYREFWQSLSAQERKSFPKEQHEQNKKKAEEVDRMPSFGSAENPVDWPDSFDGPELLWNGKHLKWDERGGNYVEAAGQTAAA